MINKEEVINFDDGKKFLINCVGHTDEIIGIKGDSDCKVVCTYSKDGSIRIWSRATGERTHIFRPIGFGGYRSCVVDMSVDGKWVAVVSNENNIFIYDVELHSIINKIYVPFGSVCHLRFNRRGDRLAILTHDGVMMYDINFDVFVEIGEGDNKFLSHMWSCGWINFDWAPNDVFAISDNSEEPGKISIKKIGLDGVKFLGAVASVGGKYPFCIAYSPCGGRLAVSYNSSTMVDIFEVGKFQILETIDASIEAAEVKWSKEGGVIFCENKYFVMEDGFFRPVYIEREISCYFPVLDDEVLIGSRRDWGIIKLMKKEHQLEIKNNHENFDPRCFRDRVNFKISSDGGSVQFKFNENEWVDFSIAGDLIGEDELTQGNVDGLDIEVAPIFFDCLGDLLSVDDILDGAGTFDGRLKLNNEYVLEDENYIVLSFVVDRGGEFIVIGTCDEIIKINLYGDVIWRRNVECSAWGLNVPLRDGVVVAGHGDGIIRWYRLLDGREILSAYVDGRQNRWVAWTPTGYYKEFNGGANCIGRLELSINKMEMVFLPLTCDTNFYRPDIWDSVLRDGELIEIINNSESLEDWHIFASDFERSDFVIKPKLYILSVGVGKYKNADVSELKFAAKDARDFLCVMQKQRGKLYRDVISKLLTDDDATADAIFEGLDWMRRQVTQHDVGVVFISGHGASDSRHDYAFLAVDADPEKMRKTTVPMDEFKKTLSSLSGKAIFFLDTCHSGNVLGNGRKSSIYDIGEIVRELTSAENGVVVFSSSTGRQYSYESESWGNGAFTKALIEGMEGAADYNGKGRITHKMLDLYMSDRVKELTDGEQSPVTQAPGGVPDFPIAVVD